MERHEQVLSEAQRRGIITADQFRQLGAMFGEAGVDVAASAAASQGGAVFDDDADASPEELSEAPRFVRGFHDILISIGLGAALLGLWVLTGSVTGPVLVIAGAIVLAELLVRRQRLALPAFCLTGFYTAAVYALVIAFVTPGEVEGLAPSTFFALLFSVPVSLMPFYLRYRVPVALATMIGSAFLLAYLLTVALVGAVTGQEFGSGSMPWFAHAIGLVLALGLFGAAMAFDLSDRLRLTRRSDVAFWLHLAAAPMLLFMVFAMIMGGEGGFWWAADPSPGDALVAILLVVAMMLVGVVIDRRAFVTSGLISLGVAIFVLSREAEIAVGSTEALAILSVGLIVLAMGAGWRALRRLVLAGLPAAMRDRLPPAVIAA